MADIANLHETGVSFGTSGIRGRVADMTDETCFLYVSAYLKWMRACGTFQDGTDVAIAADLRQSSPRIMQAAIAAILHARGTPQFYGYVPTPCLCAAAFARRIPSLMVTGSHIPADRNGIKFNQIDTEFSKADEAGLLAQSVTRPMHLFDAQGQLKDRPALPPLTDVTQAFIARYRDFFGQNALQGFRLGIYQHSSVARDIMVSLVEALGGCALAFGRTEAFHAIDTEALQPSDTHLLQSWAHEHQVDGIISTDGDADRPLLTDSMGRFIRGDILGLISAHYLQAAFVATPITSNTALEKSGLIKHIRRTRIGSPYVIEALAGTSATDGAVVGYEANGGFILGNRIFRDGKRLDALPTRDFALPIISALVAARAEGTCLTGLIRKLPQRFVASDRLTNIPTQQSVAWLATVAQEPLKQLDAGKLGREGDIRARDETDGLRFVFASGDILHLRPSGNAPELRLYVESDTQVRAATLLSGLKKVATRVLGAPDTPMATRRHD